jgi:ABC-type Fe3+-citrate transport system substrate-binding protein
MLKEGAIRYVAPEIERIRQSVPERIACLMPHFADHLLSLGLEPCGVVNEDGDGAFTPYLADHLRGTAKLGPAKQPSLEVLRSMRPQLILAEAKKHMPLFRQLNEIAPTILFKDLGQPWQDRLLFIASVIGREEKAREQLDCFYAVVDQSRARISEPWRSKRVLFANVWKPQGFQVYAPYAPLGRLMYDELGLLPLAKEIGDGKYEGHKSMFPLTHEELVGLDPDVLVLLGTAGTKAEETMEMAGAMPGYQSIRAVRTGCVHLLGELKDGNEGKGLVFYNRLLEKFFEITSNVKL